MYRLGKKHKHRFTDCNPVIKLGTTMSGYKLMTRIKFVKFLRNENVNDKFKTCLGLLN